MMSEKTLLNRYALWLLLLTGLPYGCGVCAIDTGCDHSVCQVPDWLLSPGTYKTEAAEIYVDECNSGIKAQDINGQAVTLIEQTPPMTEVDGNLQVVAIDGDWRYKLDRVSIKCGAGWGYLDPTTANNSGCSWTSQRSAPIHAQGKDTWHLLLNDYRSNPVGSCWTGPSECRVAYEFNLLRIGP